MVGGTLVTSAAKKQSKRKFSPWRPGHCRFTRSGDRLGHIEFTISPHSVFFVIRTPANLKLPSWVGKERIKRLFLAKIFKDQPKKTIGCMVEMVNFPTWTGWLYGKIVGECTIRQPIGIQSWGFLRWANFPLPSKLHPEMGWASRMSNIRIRRRKVLVDQWVGISNGLISPTSYPMDPSSC